VRLHEHILPEEASADSADDRADPVDVVHVPVAGGDSRADGAGRVHGAAGEVAGREDAEDDSEADRDGRNVAVGGAGRRHGVGEDGDHESEGGDDLDEDRLGGRDATDVVAAEMGGVERVRGESLEEQSAEDGARALAEDPNDALDDSELRSTWVTRKAMETAGFKCPPEMSAVAKTSTMIARPNANAIG